jgi:hypothetical protein
MQRYEIEGRSYQLRGGDMLVTLLGESHSTGSEPEDRGILYWLILELGSAGKGILGLSAPDSRALPRALLGIPSRQFRVTRNTRRLLDGFFEVQTDGKSETSHGSGPARWW